MTTMRTVCAALLVALGASGCAGLGQLQLSEMPTLELCEQMSGMNEGTRQLVRSELERRREACATNAAELRRQREDLDYWRYQVRMLPP